MFTEGLDENAVKWIETSHSDQIPCPSILPTDASRLRNRLPPPTQLRLSLYSGLLRDLSDDEDQEEEEDHDRILLQVTPPVTNILITYLCVSLLLSHCSRLNLQQTLGLLQPHLLYLNPLLGTSSSNGISTLFLTTIYGSL